MFVVRTLSACAGAGKTYALCDHIADGRRELKRFIVIQPTTELIDRTVSDLQNRHPGVRVTKFHSKCGSGEVVGPLIEYLKRPDDGADVVFTTWAGFMALNYFHNKAGWHLIVDEIPNAAQLYDRPIAANHHILTNCLSMESTGIKYAKLVANDGNALRTIAENKHNDEVYAVFREVSQRLRSPYFENYVLRAGYERLLRNRGANRRLTVFSILQPSLVRGFASVLLAGARIEETLLYRIWSSQKVVFEDYKELATKLRYNKHQNGALVRFYYFSDINWSKSLSASTNGKAVKELIGHCEQLFPGKRFLYLANNGSEDARCFSAISEATALPGWAHGLNQYQDRNNVVISGAYNGTPSSIKFLEEFYNIDSDAQRVAMMNHLVYQSLCRCSVRDPDNKDDKIIIVPDEATALWCQTLFPSSSVDRLDIGLAPSNKRGRKQIHPSVSEKKKSSRQRIDLRKEQASLFMDRDGVINLMDKNLIVWDEYTIIDIGINVPHFKGSLIGQRRVDSWDAKIYELEGIFMATEDQMISFLTVCALRAPVSKDINYMISPALFDIYASKETEIGKKNVVLASGIWLDLDDTDLKQKEFATLFSNLTIFTYETYNSTVASLRYRVYIPTTDYISHLEDREIVKQIIVYVEQSGYQVKIRKNGLDNQRCHGIDAKLNSSDKFLLPCKTKDGRTKTYHHYKGQGRGPLAVDDWLNHPICLVEEDLDGDPIPPVAPQCPTHSGGLTPYQRTVIEKGLEVFRRAEKGKGRVAFYGFHRRLKHAGIWGIEWEMAMQEAASYARSPNERMSEIGRLRRQM